MKFSCDQQELVRALSVVSKAVTTRTTTQVMKGILIEAKEGGTLTMSASDLDISIQNTMQADVQEEGSVIAMAKLFVDIIRKLPHSEITIESDDDFNITIRSANSEFQVVGMSPDEFPERIKEQEGDKYIEFNRREFSSMIEKTAFAASIEEARGIITGVLLEIEPDGMNMVAIDGYRMAINKSAMVTGASGNVVIAAKMLGEIGKILEPFYRVDKSRARKEGGMGMGLALCSEIVRLHHARLEIESRLEVGTTVKVVFPDET